MDEIERPETVGEVVTPTEEGEAERRGETRAPQSHEDNRRFQAARLGGERAGYERAMRDLAGQESERERLEEEQRRFIAEDALAFERAFPDVSLSELDASESFRRFCGSRYGRESLAGLYADYLEIVGGAVRAAQARGESRAARSTGSGGSGSYEALNARQRSELDAWNRAFPQMRMSAREYLSRSK